MSGNYGNVIFFEKILDAFAHFVGNSPATGDDCLKIGLCMFDLDSVGLCMLCIFEYLSRF